MFNEQESKLETLTETAINLLTNALMTEYRDIKIDIKVKATKIKSPSAHSTKIIGHERF